MTSAVVPSTPGTSEPSRTFTVTWQPPQELINNFGDSQKSPNEWAQSTIKVRCDESINDLLGKIKKEIQNRLEVSDDFEMDGLPGMMKGITKDRRRQETTALLQQKHGDNANNLIDTLSKLSVTDKRKAWRIRFTTRIRMAVSSSDSTTWSLDLDFGSGSRFMHMSDMWNELKINNKQRTPSLEVALWPEEIEGSVWISKDDKTESFICPIRQNVKFVHIGNVQSNQAGRFNLDETKSSKKALRIIMRKNAIVARYPETNRSEMESDFRLTPCWEMKAVHKGVVFRIGDPEAGATTNLAKLQEKKTKLWDNLEPYSHDISALATEIQRVLRENSPGKSKAYLTAPSVPPMTFDRFDPASIDNSSTTEETDADCYIAINVVYDHGAPVQSEFYPTSRYVQLSKGESVGDVEKKLFKASRAALQYNESRSHASGCSWWIMPERGCISPMRKIGSNEYPAMYIKSARKRKAGSSVQLYMECHFGEIIEETIAEVPE